MTADEIRRLAFSQKLILYAILGNIIFYVAQGAFVGPMAKDPQLAPIALLVTLGTLGLALVVLCVMIVGVVMMSQALRINIVVTIFRCLFLLVPCLGLVVLLVLNQKATAALKERGVRVGFMGANRADLENVQGDAEQSVGEVFD